KKVSSKIDPESHQSAKLTVMCCLSNLKTSCFSICKKNMIRTFQILKICSLVLKGRVVFGNICYSQLSSSNTFIKTEMKICILGRRNEIYSFSSEDIGSNDFQSASVILFLPPIEVMTVFQEICQQHVFAKQQKSFVIHYLHYNQ